MTSDADPVGQNKPSPDAQQNAKGQSDGPDSQILSASTKQVPPTKTECRGSQREQKHWIDYVTVVLELVGLIVLCVYAAYTIRIYCANKEAADAARDAANAAVRSANDAEGFFRTDERAWLELEPFKHERAVMSKVTRNLFSPDAKVFAQRVFIKNYGRTIARNIQVRTTNPTADVTLSKDDTRIRFIQDTLRLGRNIGTDQTKWIYIFPQFVPNSIAPGSTTNAPILLPGIDPYTVKDSNVVMYTYAIGRIDYSDIFGVKHWKTFCFVTGSETLTPCESGNDEDDNPEIPSKK